MRYNDPNNEVMDGWPTIIVWILFAIALYCSILYFSLPMNEDQEHNKPEFPQAGDKVIFKGVPEFYFPNFTNMRKDAEVLEIGKQYTLSKVRVNSSWVTVYLEEFPDLMLNLGFFKYERN